MFKLQCNKYKHGISHLIAIMGINVDICQKFTHFISTEKIR